jgi:hypothetical protein
MKMINPDMYSFNNTVNSTKIFDFVKILPYLGNYEAINP